MEDPGELCEPVLNDAAIQKTLKTLLWQGSQRLVHLAQHRNGSASVCLLKELLPSDLLRSFASNQ